MPVINCQKIPFLDLCQYLFIGMKIIYAIVDPRFKTLLGMEKNGPVPITVNEKIQGWN